MRAGSSGGDGVGRRSGGRGATERRSLHIDGNAGVAMPVWLWTVCCSEPAPVAVLRCGQLRHVVLGALAQDVLSDGLEVDRLQVRVTELIFPASSLA